jgi:hypothetical protein
VADARGHERALGRAAALNAMCRTEGMTLAARHLYIEAVAFGRNRLRSLGWSVLLSAGLLGCGGHIKITEYPADWPPRTASASAGDCLDISGTYTSGSGAPLLAFLLFGITDETSLDWKKLIRLYDAPSSAQPDRMTVTINHPDPTHIEFVVAVDGRAAARQVLTRSHKPAADATWLGQHSQSFRCEPNAIVLNSSYVHDWLVYNLPEEDKKRRYRRMYGAVGPLGVSEGYVDFSKANDGSLVARVRLYGCYPCLGLDEYWQRWPSALIPPP